MPWYAPSHTLRIWHGSDACEVSPHGTGLTFHRLGWCHRDLAWKDKKNNTKYQLKNQPKSEFCSNGPAGWLVASTSYSSLCRSLQIKTSLKIATGLVLYIFNFAMNREKFTRTRFEPTSSGLIMPEDQSKFCSSGPAHCFQKTTAPSADHFKLRFYKNDNRILSLCYFIFFVSLFTPKLN